MNARRWAAALCLALTAASARAQTVRLRGTVVSPDAVTTNAIVTIQGDRIAAVAPAGANERAVDVGGVIFPGLIDLHNHLTWNAMPNWHPPRIFGNRYEWQDTTDYLVNLSGPYYSMLDARRGCDFNLFGEVKALINGATATVGGLAPGRNGPNDCVAGLVRNLDFASGFYGTEVNKEPFKNIVFPLAPRADEADAIRTVNPSGPSTGTRAVVMHLSEGADAAAAREFQQAKALGYLKRGVSLIHDVALNADQVKDLKDSQVGLVWSPHSNLILYGKTADVRTAFGQVDIALAPDWSPSGSAGMLEELQVAYRYTVSVAKEIKDTDLVKMATSTPAKLAAIDDKVGTIAANRLADLVVMKPAATAHQALLGGAQGVRLVMIGGVARYGDPALMQLLAPSAQLESIVVCGEPRLLNIDDPAAPHAMAQAVSRIADAMRPLGISPAPLAACGQP